VSGMVLVCYLLSGSGEGWLGCGSADPGPVSRETTPARFT
jgi:hypothetical protein